MSKEIQSFVLCSLSSRKELRTFEGIIDNPTDHFYSVFYSMTASNRRRKEVQVVSELQGCRRSASCKFVHSLEAILKKNRCYTCQQSGSFPTKTEAMIRDRRRRARQKQRVLQGRPGNPTARFVSLTTSQDGTDEVFLVAKFMIPETTTQENLSPLLSRRKWVPKIFLTKKTSSFWWR